MQKHPIDDADRTYRVYEQLGMDRALMALLDGMEDRAMEAGNPTLITMILELKRRVNLAAAGRRIG